MLSISNEDCEKLFELELNEKMLRLPLISSESVGALLYIIRLCVRYLIEQNIATITANKKIMPNVQKITANLDCDIHKTSGPKYADECASDFSVKLYDT